MSLSGHASKNGARDLLETIKLTKYVEDIRPDIVSEMLKEFEDAVRIAKNMEVALNSKSASKVNNLTGKNKNTLYEALIKFSKD